MSDMTGLDNDDFDPEPRPQRNIWDDDDDDIPEDEDDVIPYPDDEPPVDNPDAEGHEVDDNRRLKNI